MATFKTCVRNRRADGFYIVYIRVTHNRKVGYIRTDKIVNDSGIKKGEVIDAYVNKYCSNMIVNWVERLNKHNTSNWTITDVIDFLNQDGEDISFSDYARKHIDMLTQTGHARTARNYELALQHFERFMGTNQIMFSQMTSLNVNAWIQSMSQTHRAKEMYPVNMRQVFKEACKQYNDYDRGVIRIKTNPWVKVEIPAADKSVHRAITPQECRVFFSAAIPESRFKVPLAELGRDVAMMVLCLAGINTVDIFKLRKEDYYDGIIHYKRSKTMNKRTDEAYFEMQVPSILQPIFEKYKAPKDDPYLFEFHRRMSSTDSFSANVNKGIKQICESIGIKKEHMYSVYTFRHTWGTLAQNDCGATLDEVAFAMNHSTHYVTRTYVKIDYSPAWKLNDKVIELVFFTDKESHREHIEDNTFEKFSVKNMMKGTVFFRGKELGTIQDIGFHNVDEIIERLIPYIPDDIPQRCIVQFRVENIDKKQTAVYERMKGKSF